MLSGFVCRVRAVAGGLLLLGLLRSQGQQGLSFSGLWLQDGAVPWEERHGLTSAQFKTVSSNFVAQGFRPISLSGYELNGVAVYSAIWDKQPGPERIARHDLTSAQYQTIFNDLMARGYCPLQTRCYTVDGTEYYTGLWEKNPSVSWAARHRMSSTLFLANNAEFSRQGYRLMDLSGCTVDGIALYTGIWMKLPGGAWRARHQMRASEFETLANRYESQGYGVRSLNGYSVGDVEFYAAIWDKSVTNRSRLYRAMSLAGYESTLSSPTNAGYRPILITGHRKPSDIAPVPDLVSSGIPVPLLKPFDDAMKRFMAARSIPSGVLCVSKGDRILMEHAFGYKNPAKTQPLNPNALFRIASLVKPLTAAAVRDLIAKGKLSLSTLAFNLPGQPQPGLLKIPIAGTPDVRLNQVTVQHLLEHKGGWNSGVSGDPMFQANTIAAALHVANPPSQADILRHTLGRPLDHDPGSTYVYSNFGYLVLGQIVEAITGKDYVAYLQSEVFAPLGVSAEDLQLGHSLPARRNPREPWYSDPASGASVFDPHQSVPFADGVFDLEAMDSHGGLICTARAYSRFLMAYWIDGTRRVGQGQDWTFFGSLPGTFTLGRQRPDGVNIVAFFNQRTDASGKLYDDIRPLLDTVADTIETWPTQDLRGER